jgi:hypothetical protein
MKMPKFEILRAFYIWFFCPLGCIFSAMFVDELITRQFFINPWLLGFWALGCMGQGVIAYQDWKRFPTREAWEKWMDKQEGISE